MCTHNVNAHEYVLKFLQYTIHTHTYIHTYIHAHTYIFDSYLNENIARSYLTKKFSIMHHLTSSTFFSFFLFVLFFPLFSYHFRMPKADSRLARVIIIQCTLSVVSLQFYLRNNYRWLRITLFKQFNDVCLPHKLHIFAY